MKKIFILFAATLLALFAFCSCGTDSATLTGTWNLDYETYDGSVAARYSGEIRWVFTSSTITIQDRSGASVGNQLEYYVSDGYIYVNDVPQFEIEELKIKDMVLRQVIDPLGMDHEFYFTKL